MVSKIEWCDATWNCVTGCTKTSPGCLKCYAEAMTRRLQGMYFAQCAKGHSETGFTKYKDGFNKVVLHYDMLSYPATMQKPCRIFVNSMSDTFHADVHNGFLNDIFTQMRVAHWHTYQVLTKRSERLLERDPHIDWYRNIWMGVTVENERYKSRIDHLRATGAQVKYLSCEPLLGSLTELNLDGIHQVIVGAETGSGARPMNPAWAREIQVQCREQGVAFFMKAMSRKAEIPADLMIREYPKGENCE